MMTRRRLLLGTALAAGAIAAGRRATGGPITIDEIGDRVQTVGKGELPEFAGPAPHIRAAYRYALDRDDLRNIPCFCGCGRFGHTSNRECYVKTRHPDGRVTFTSHAAT